MSPFLLRIFYQLRNHRIGEWALERVLVTAAWVVAGFVLLRWFMRGQPPLAAWHWLVLALLILGGLALFVGARLAAARRYVRFDAQPGLAPPVAAALTPQDKVQARVTGRFEVEGKAGFFADLLAYWRTFATREHAVMAIVHPSRFLGLARTAGEHVGMWYIFFHPHVIEEIAAGELNFGGQRAPALRVAYRHTPQKAGKRSPRTTREVVYLAFEDDGARQKVWADLLADGVDGAADI